MDESRARALLRAERAEVATLLRETEAAVSIDEQAPDSATDYGDASLPLTEGANDEAVAEQLRDRLAALDRALARLEAGTYGRSVLSGKPIPDQRLEADPAAELTVEEAKASRLRPGAQGPSRSARHTGPVTPRRGVTQRLNRPRADIGGTGTPEAFGGAGGPDTIAVFAIRPARTDTGGYGGSSPREGPDARPI
jgi:DnaK suppressor protein